MNRVCHVTCMCRVCHVMCRVVPISSDSTVAVIVRYCLSKLSNRLSLK